MRSWGRGRMAVVAGIVVIGVSLVAVTSVSGEFEFCEPGSGTGQCERPDGVAIDAETGHVYVADTGHDRIEVFDEEGVFKGTIGAGVLSAPRGVAVDNDSTSPTYHDIFVIEAKSRVLRFDPAGNLMLGFGWGVAKGSAELQTCGPEATPPTVSCGDGIEGKGKCQLTSGSQIAVGPGGIVDVADSAQVGASETQGFKGRIEKFGPDGTCKEEQVLFEGAKKLLIAVAADSTGDVYAAMENEALGILKLDPGGSAVCEIDSDKRSTALAVDPASDRLYAAQGESRVRGSGAYRIVAEYGPGPGCPAVRRFGYGEIEDPVLGLAVFPGVLAPGRAGDALISENSGSTTHRVLGLGLPPEGPIIVPGSVIANPISNTKATLGAEINPEGAETEVSIEYVEEALCKADEKAGGECFENAQSSGAEPLGAEDFKLHGAETQFGCPDPINEQAKLAEGKCLKPETRYRFRVLAENADGKGNSPFDGGFFETRPWLEIGSVWSTAVGPGSAVLHAEVNPLGVPVTARFEVIDDAHFSAGGFKDAFAVPSLGEAPLDYGSGEVFGARSVALDGLAPGTTYHYRLTADNALIEPVPGSEQTFSTFAPPGSEDCPANEAFRTGPSALLPDCRAYEMVSPLDKGNGDIVALKGNLSVTPAVLNQSSVSGSRFAYGSSRAFDGAPSAPWTSQYVAERGTGGWESHAISSPIGQPLFENIFPNTETELKALSPDLCDAWLRTIADPPLALGAQKGYPNIYRRTDDECGGSTYEALTTAKWQSLKPGNEIAFGLELQGLSADGSKAIFLSPDSLVGTGAPNQKPQLYLWAGGPKPVFTCVLPNGTTLNGPCSAGLGSVLGSGAGLGRYALEQGAISADGERVFWTADIGPGKLYMRERGEQGKVAGECSAGTPCTIAVSAEGEALSGESTSEFRAAARDGSKAIFTTGDDLYEAQIGEEAGHPALTGTTLIAHGVEGVMGVSEDASHVYFASSKAIVGAGKDSAGDEAEEGKPNLYLYREGTYAFIGTLSAQDVSPSFRGPVGTAPVANLARLTPDGGHAAFVSSAPLTGYDNTDAVSGIADSEVFLYDAGTGKLVCASCNPSGGRPVGRENGGKKTILYNGPDWMAAWLVGHETNLYASRELAADGSRLFFTSGDALVARDTNGRADVYQWEAPGTGGCKGIPQDKGCVDLISSGQSAQDSEFLDASPSGDDVFFTTLSSLLPQDYGLVDVYDARVQGGYPPLPAAGAECEGEACQSPPPAPAHPTPATSVPAGDGNISKEAKSPCPKGKVRGKGKTRCVKRHAKKHHRRQHHRTGAERGAAQ